VLRPLLPIALAPLLASLVCTGCGTGAGVGSAQVFTQAEDTIPGGLQAGDGPENIQDGWDVRYTRFLVTMGGARATRSDTGEQLRDDAVYVLDLLRAPAQGYVIASFDDVAAVRWDRFGFDLPNASAKAKALAPTTESDRAFLVERGDSIYFEGAIESDAGQSCPPGKACRPASIITFRWGFPAGTSFDDCGTSDGNAGFAVPSGSSVQIKPTLHGDHWFFSNFTAGVELTARRAQYVADADLDGDGETTIDELRGTPAADVFAVPEYNLAGALGGPIETAYDYVLAEIRTMGHFQGDGDCPTRSVLK